MRNNPCLEAAVAELEAVGIRDYQVAHGGKHIQVRWTVAGHTMRMLTVPGSASDWRSPRNTRADIRKLLRHDGLLGDEHNGHAAAKPTGERWRRQIETLAHHLTQVNIPTGLALERNTIVAALHRLIAGGEP